MPTRTTKHETALILQGKVDALSRPYPTGCPHNVGDTLALFYESEKGKSFPYALVRIKSIRPSTLDARMQDDALAKREGYTNAQGWLEHLKTLYGPSLPRLRGKIFRFQFNVEKVLVKNATSEVRKSQ